MSCDVRPVITSTTTLYVNPYETPPSCPCTPSSHSHRTSISSSRRCPSHGCCSLDVTTYRCARQCRKLTKYHRYVCTYDSEPQRLPAHSHRQSGSHFHSYPYSSPHPSRANPTPFATPHRAPWRTLRTFDRNPDFCAVESSDFHFAVSELLDIGRVLLHAESELEKARLRVERERARHRSAHGAACERVLQEWECGWTRRIGDMVVETDDLKLSIEVLADCWVKYVGLLRKYELLGQRRVGGIVEDRGQGKYRGDGSSGEVGRDEDARPWRYARRESWDRKYDGREGRQGKVQTHKRECGPEQVRRRERRQSVRFHDEVNRRRKSHHGSSDGKRQRSWWRF
ncbi:uncharacterized protein ColSpa_09689 [Colletotrichum spaethianum]|uniref:Uncharacterized protein n=1 Tax=Colletotrichum spaethianum TaxID=700344 RepID=A0AA37PC15_9PEZI|nr:uncharacterized protein ColSpa_09689 [Colletotrichum spaethianum]GKT49508.1 hypothetical protein ColSpa_09689 [Colletotrichum spaethianum]